MNRKRCLTVVLGSMLVLGGVGFAQRKEPAKNVSGARHPNLAAAQTAARNAFDHITKAQEANEWDLGGHAKKAKELLEEVNKELKLAAEASNARK